VDDRTREQGRPRPRPGVFPSRGAPHGVHVGSTAPPVPRHPRRGRRTCAEGSRGGGFDRHPRGGAFRRGPADGASKPPPRLPGDASAVTAAGAGVWGSRGPRACARWRATCVDQIRGEDAAGGVPANLGDTRTRRDTARTPAGHGSPNFNEEAEEGAAIAPACRVGDPCPTTSCATRGLLPNSNRRD